MAVAHPGEYRSVPCFPYPEIRLTLRPGRRFRARMEAFLELDLPGSKVVVGNGSDMATLRARYPDAHYVGYRYGEDLARRLAAADVFVFPSRTDTFGLVMLEAMACGVPVAAYPVTGPRDVVIPGRTGVLDEDLGAAVRAAVKLEPSDCVAYARRHTWPHCVFRFLENPAPFPTVRSEPPKASEEPGNV